MQLTPQLCERQSAGRFKLRWHSHASFQRVWDTAGTLSEQPLSIWAASGINSMRGGKERIVLGHFAANSLGVPKSHPILEVVDMKSGVFSGSRDDKLRAFVEIFFPPPRRFRQVWVQHSTMPLFVWEAVPPSHDFIAIGMVCTVSDAEPPVQSMRCMPRLWTERLPPNQVQRLWSNAGTSGTPACFWVGITTGATGARKRGAVKSANEALFLTSAGVSAEEAPQMPFMPVFEFYASMPPEDAMRSVSAAVTQSPDRSPVLSPAASPEEYGADTEQGEQVRRTRSDT